ncbi:hypothetical protein ACHAWU_010198 [Discostella pseudostelligera]|uniref:Uncharacterized protein n=1 Tax=Discostella pseudostelligera TaxID=259834 RepID=A0ABD3MB04_9STRA
MDDIALPSASTAATSADEAANNTPGVANGTAAAAAAAAGVVIPVPATTTIEEQLTQLTQRQDEQAQLLSELRSRILELEEVIHDMKQGSNGDDGRGSDGAAPLKRESNSNVDVQANRPPHLSTTATSTSAQPNANDHPSSKLVNDDAVDEGILSSTPTTNIIATTDDEISNILASRQERNLWPLKRKYCTSFSREHDLMKLRFHNSELYPHKTVRIPKQPGTSASSSSSESTTAVAGITTAVGTHAEGGNDALASSATISNTTGNANNYYGTLGNKEGRLICRLCSGKTMNRNSSWMCSTCVVPLCIDIVDGDPNSSCFVKWHTCHDLVMENYVLNGELREKRSMKKQRTSAGGGGAGEGHHVGVQEGNHNHSSEEVDLDALGIVDDATKAV